ncbi:MAG TPA: flagellar protein FlgN, partial [Firmicutes bacterium]|nr:flagellar protein FlgN [Bacillota bacterium]
MTGEEWHDLKEYVTQLESFAAELLRLSQEKHEALVSADIPRIERIMDSERGLLCVGASFMKVPRLVSESGLRRACEQAPDDMKEELDRACERIAMHFEDVRRINQSNMAFLRKALEYVAFMRKVSEDGTYRLPTTQKER